MNALTKSLKPFPEISKLTEAQQQSARKKAHSSMLDELFTPNGFWAPGIKLFRSLGFRMKATVISVCFSVPIAILMVFVLQAKQEIIGFAKQERIGVEYIQQLVPLMQHGQRVRMAATAAAAGVPLANHEEIKSNFAAQLKKMSDVNEKLGGKLNTKDVYRKMQDKITSAEKTVGSKETVFAAYVGVLDSMHDVLDQVTDTSNLALDPDLGSYYTMDAAVVNGPKAIEAMGQARGLGGALLAMNDISSAHRIGITQQYAIAKHHMDGMDSSIKKVINAAPELGKTFRHTDALKYKNDFLSTVRATFLSDEIVRMEAADYRLVGSKAIDAGYELNGRLLTQLDMMLSDRIADTEKNRNLSLGITTFCLLLVAYMFRCFHMVTKGGMREVQRHLRAISEGDLTTNPVPWGHDEAARLMETLATMQQSLRSLVHQVRTSSDSIYMASSEVADGTMDLSNRTEKTAANLEQSAAAVEQISATIRNTSQSVQDASHIATSNSDVAARGGKVIGEVVNTMDGIHASSRKISDIIGVIDSIAFQTNILALNAAVEAARAGEQGRGFAVVASEVRNLAQRSAAAAQEIKALITSSVEQVESGAVVVKGAGDTIMEIVSNAERIKQLLAEIATGAREQATGMSQVGQGVSELDRATQENAALVEESAAASTSLKQQAQRLSESVSRFKLPA
jgi:methyl-accepting chemotaxis protein